MLLPGDLRRCTAITRRGNPCRAWAVAGSDRCIVHQEAGSEGLPAEPAGRDLVEADRADLLSSVIDDTLQKQVQISSLIDELLSQEEVVSDKVIKLLALHSQNAGRIGRLLRDQKVVQGENRDALLELLDQTLDELSAELGIEL